MKSTVRCTLPRKGLLLCAGAALLLFFVPSAHAQTQASGAQPVFRDGQAQVVPAFEDSSAWIRQELWVETSFDSDGDGQPDRVHVSVTRPEQTETEGLKVPVIYGSSPYYSGVATGDSFFWKVKQEVGAPPPERSPAAPFEARTKPFISDAFVDTWVPRGFAVVHSESPGTGLSQGCPTVGGRNESLAPKAVIDWLNGRAKGFTSVDSGAAVTADWATGKVGMTGTSYNGTLPLAAATTGVDGLEAIIPIAPNTSYYHYYRSNGLVRHPGGYLGEDIDVLYDFIHSRSGRRGYCDAAIRDSVMAKGQDRQTGDYNAFWASRDYLNVVDSVQAATLMAHAFNDWNVMPEHSVRVYEALKANGVPAEAYFHQGGHGGAPPLELMNRWFTRYLYGVENGVEEAPHAWIVREDAARMDPTPYPDYPHPAASPVMLYPEAGERTAGRLHGVGSLRLSSQPAPDPAAPDPAASDPAMNTEARTETLVDNVSFSGGALAKAEWTSHRLLYATPKLAEAVHLSGTARLTVRVASSKPAANLSVWLVALPWTEESQSTESLITRGWADPQNHDTLAQSAPLVPSQFYDLTFDLQPDDQVIEAGERIGLMIFSSDRDFTLWPAPGTKLTVDLDATVLELPVVGGAPALTEALGRPAR